MDTLREVTRSGAGAPSTGWRRSTFTRSWAAAALMILGLVLGIGLTFAPPPLPVAVVETQYGLVVTSVAVGSEPWASGIRPGVPARWVEYEDGTGRLYLDTQVGAEVGYRLHQAPVLPDALIIGALVGAAAVVLRLARLPGSAALLGAGIGLFLSPIGPQIGLPAALPLVLLPTAAAAAAVRVPARRQQRVFDLFGFGVLVLIVAVGLWLLSVSHNLSWINLWAAPVALAVMVGVVGELVVMRARIARSPANSQSRWRRWVSAAVPLAADSRLEGVDEERSRLALEIHNRVLPHIERSARAIRQAEAADHDAADRLAAVASELRGVMQRSQTISLEIGGVAEALRAEVEEVGAPGVRVEFIVRAVGGRPPGRIELAAYRVGQAAIDNAVRHSGGRHVEVSATSGPDSLEVVVRDDGAGLEDGAEESARRRGRIGLAQMRLRTEAVGASLEICRRAESGTEVRFLWER